MTESIYKYEGRLYYTNLDGIEEGVLVGIDVGEDVGILVGFDVGKTLGLLNFHLNYNQVRKVDNNLPCGCFSWRSGGSPCGCFSWCAAISK